MALQGHSAMAGSRRPFSTEARFRSQGIHLGTFDGQSDTCVLSRRYLPPVLHNPTPSVFCSHQDKQAKDLSKIQEK